MIIVCSAGIQRSCPLKPNSPSSFSVLYPLATVTELDTNDEINRKSITQLFFLENCTKHFLVASVASLSCLNSVVSFLSWAYYMVRDADLNIEGLYLELDTPMATQLPFSFLVWELASFKDYCAAGRWINYYPIIRPGSSMRIRMGFLITACLCWLRTGYMSLWHFPRDLAILRV